MILVSHPTKIHTSYLLKLSERPKRLSNFHLQWFLLIEIKILCFLQICFKLVFCTLLVGQVSSPGGIANTTFGEINMYLSNYVKNS